MSVPFRHALYAIAAVLVATISSAAQARDFVIAISPEIGSVETRKMIGGSIVSFIFSPRLKLGDRVVVANALDQSRVAVFAIPSHAQYNNDASRRKHLEKPIADLIQFLAKVPPPRMPDNAAAISAPKLLASATSVVPAIAETGLDLIVIGNPIHVDALQPHFSMIGARVPSDAHLTASIEESVFGRDGRGMPLKDVRVHWVTLGAEWLGDLHESRVRRMWAAYVDLRGGMLMTFKADVRSVFDALGSKDLRPIPIEPALDRVDKRLTMNIVRRDADNRAAESLFESKEVKREAIARPPGKLRVGLRWERGARTDIDLYAKTISAKDWIYFGETETAEGRFYKYESDPTHPSKRFEYIEFNGTIDLRQLLIAINFYEGSLPGGPRGQIRLDVDGVIHEVDFHIRSPQGNKGLGFPEKMARHPAWIVISAADIAAGKLSFVSPGH